MMYRLVVVLALVSLGRCIAEKASVSEAGRSEAKQSHSYYLGDDAYRYSRMWSANPLYMSAWYSKEMFNKITGELTKCYEERNNLMVAAGADPVQLEALRPLVIPVDGRVCEQKLDKGTCRNYTQRYYFDAKQHRCVRFYYRGCGGNMNNFRSERDCESACLPLCSQPLDRGIKQFFLGVCDAEIPRFYFDSRTNRCHSFKYTGCGGNNNNFLTELDCKSACVNSRCEQRRDSGIREPGFKWTHRYYHDTKSNSCRGFWYTGHGGNSNNFEKKSDCEAFC